MGEIINGVYVPSNEDLLQHYGKKGMKWKKRKNMVGDAAEALTEDLAYAADKRAIDEHVKDALRDKQTIERNMSDNISKIKSGVRMVKLKIRLNKSIMMLTCVMRNLMSVQLRSWKCVVNMLKIWRRHTPKTLRIDVNNIFKEKE